MKSWVPNKVLEHHEHPPGYTPASDLCFPSMEFCILSSLVALAMFSLTVIHVHASNRPGNVEFGSNANLLKDW